MNPRTLRKKLISPRSVVGILGVVAASGIALTVFGTVSGASPSVAPAVPPTSHPIPQVTSLPPDCPSGHLYQPGGQLCIDGVRIRPAPAGWPANKAKLFYAQEELAAQGIGKPTREPYVAPNTPGAVSQPNGTYAFAVNFGAKTGKIIPLSLQNVPQAFQPNFVETNQWQGWSGSLFIILTAGRDAKTGLAGVQLQTSTETQVVSPTSGVLVPGPKNNSEFLVSPNVAGSLKVASFTGNILTLQLVGTTTQFQFNVATDTYVG